MHFAPFRFYLANTKKQSLKHWHICREKKHDFWGNRPEIIEFCKKVYKTKTLILGADVLQKCSC